MLFGICCLCFFVGMGSCVSKVVGGSVGCVYHVCCFAEFRVLVSFGERPRVFRLRVVEVELEPGLSPVFDNFAVHVVVDIVFSLFASHEALRVLSVLERFGGGPFS